MEPIAEGVHQVSAGVNAFIIDGDDGVVLVDTGLPRRHGRIVDQLRSIGRSLDDVRAILITHAHVDHAGGAAFLADASGADVFASSADAAAIEGAEPMKPPPFLDRAPFLKPLFRLLPGAAPVAVHRRLEADQSILPADMRFLPTPGHTPGHTSFVLERAGGVVFVGDAAVAKRDGSVGRGWMNRSTPTFDASIGTLAGAGADVAFFGHSPPIPSGASDAFGRLAASFD